MAVPAPDVIKILGKEAMHDEMRILGAFQYMYRHGFCFLIIYRLSSASCRSRSTSLAQLGIIHHLYLLFRYLPFEPLLATFISFNPTCMGTDQIEVRNPSYHLFLWLTMMPYE